MSEAARKKTDAIRLKRSQRKRTERGKIAAENGREAVSESDTNSEQVSDTDSEQVSDTDSDP